VAAPHTTIAGKEPPFRHGRRADIPDSLPGVVPSVRGRHRSGFSSAASALDV